ncbi:condensin complex subunit 3 [Drosophila sulfurigaster albostrigata]|uniref:condensin complex subunit 3 n=1 Tax=Drosophila sulfurigaster albostrigata TaxID=89887 RepID=UPI002D21C3CA|nr:condensin complex subunit 3 [Drosophila sulfurigaster albostrigata]
MSKPKVAKKRNKKANQKENVEEPPADTITVAPSNHGRTAGQTAMYTILSNAQLNETFHKRYTKEMQQLYSKLDHDAFMITFIKMFKTVLEADENNDYGNTALAFCAKFVTSFESEKTHPILAETFSWLLTTISNSPHIRYRICFFVNLILKHLGPNAALDDTQCDQILHYMLDRLKDVSPSVRKEAVLAMQRLQIPDNPNDEVLVAYRYHLSADPASSVRQCIITCMGRNYITVPHILQRLWDVDEKVRRHTYINMCNYPVRSYKVSQRLTLVERGLNDSSESVRKNVIKYMLKAWIESYQQNFIQLIAALKLDSNEEEIIRFRRVVRQMLMVIFERHDNQMLLEQLPLSEDCELHRCVPHETLTVELLLYWQCLSDYFQQSNADEFELILPELSVFCDYIKKFCQFQKPEMDKFAQIEFQCMLLSLVEMLQTYDLGDEIGRGNMKELITHLLKECLLDHKIIAGLVRCMELLESDVSARMQFFINIIYEICELNAKQNDLVHDRSLIDKLMSGVDTSLVMKIRTLKVRILELEEMEENFVRQKEYIRAQAVNDEKIAATDEYTELVQPLLEKHGVEGLPARPKLSKQERVLKGLHISFYMVASKQVNSLNPTICKLYKDFVCRHLASSEMNIFEWAIKCGTTFSMFYESYTKEVFDVVVDQFYKDNNLRLCETAAQCLFELMDHYGVDYFIDMNQTATNQGQAPKSKRRLLYTMQDFYEGEEDRSQSQNSDQNTDIIGMMGFFVEKVVDKGILVAIVRGLCRLVLRGQLDNRSDIVEKLLKRYFNPLTEPIVSQVLAIFFEKIVDLKLQRILQPCLLPIVWSIMNSSYDSPLHDVVPGHVTKFFIDLTAQEKSTPESNIHNQMALSFLHYIKNYYTERKEMCRLLAKDLITLKLNVLNETEMKDEMLELAENLLNSELEPRLVRNITDFKDMLNGCLQPPARNPEGHESENDGEDCESIAATTASTSECPAPARKTIVPTIIEEPGEIASGPASPAPAAATRTAPTTPVPTETSEPVLTTFGKQNEVGLRFLRRSLHNSISHSDGDSICGSQSPSHESETAEQQKNKASEISRKNLRRRKTGERLQLAMARGSQTPEKRPLTPEPTETSVNESRDETINVTAIEFENETASESLKQTINKSINKSSSQSAIETNNTSTNKSARESTNENANTSTNKSARESPNETANKSTNQTASDSTNVTTSEFTNVTSSESTNVTTSESTNVTTSESTNETTAATIIEVVPTTPVSNKSHNNSEVIEDSPTVVVSSSSPPTHNDRSSLRMRSLRNRRAAVARLSPTASSKKRKVLHLEIQTPLRNGRKRVLRKSVQASASQSSDSGTSSQRVSPLRKQQRLDAKTPVRKSNSVVITVNSEKNTSSPTGSTTSSVKENTMPTKNLAHKTPQPKRLSTSTSQPLATTPASRITTRNSARKMRIDAMCMTRKRMSLELSLTETNAKMPTPKRVRKEVGRPRRTGSIDRSTHTLNTSTTSTARTTRSASKSATSSRESRKTRAAQAEAASNSFVSTRNQRK